MTDFKPGDRAMRGSLKATVVAVEDGWAWVRYGGGSPSTVDIRDLEPIPAHPIPSEVNTAWQDRNGDTWMVDEHGNLTSAVAYFGDEPEHWAAPFTRLVPEGSEREAAFREVVQTIGKSDIDSAFEISHWLLSHFLSGVDQ